jgi:hypothetical protein
MRAAAVLVNAVLNDKCRDAALSALANVLSDGNRIVRSYADEALNHVIQKSTSIELLNEMEMKLKESYSTKRKEYRYGKERELVQIELVFSKLMAEIAKRKNELAPKRDILLDDIPKPPKKGEIYQQIRGTVRN